MRASGSGFDDGLPTGLVGMDALRTIPLPVVIFGAGAAGSVLLAQCRAAGVPVASFCDNNINKRGTALDGVPIHHFTDLRATYDDAFFIIAAADIGDVVLQLDEAGYRHWCAGGPLLRDAEFATCAAGDGNSEEFVDYAVGTCVLCHDNYLQPDKIFVRSVDVVITERCSLKCRDCSNLMQYYESPQNYAAEDVLATIDALCAAMDEINEFRVIGGEPFMNKDIHQVLDRLNREPKVRRVVIYTNGTIVPKGANLEAMRHPKTLLMITDYGALSRNLAPLVKVLDDNGIGYRAQAARNWTDCASIEARHRSPDAQRQIFKSCCAKNLFTLLDGKLYRCPFAAHVDRLAAVPPLPDDRVVVHDPAGPAPDPADLKQRLHAYIYDLPYLESCDYCAGRFLGDPEITPAIQVDKPLPYRLRR